MKKSRSATGLLAFCAFTLLALNVFGQGALKATRIKSTELPKSIKYTGNLQEALRFSDKQGDFIAITTETGETASKTATDEGARDAALYAYLYKVSGGSASQVWKVQDFIKDCPVDIEANFIANTFQVTDLNQDGVAEIWLLYKTVCHGDVSPSNMKIIMYQGQQKFAMRGRNKVEYAAGKFEGGEYTFDEAFSNGPAAFRTFATKLWNKHIMQVWEK